MTKIKEIISRLKFKSALILSGYAVLMAIAAVIFSKYVDQGSLQRTVENTGSFGIIIYFFIEVFYVAFTPLLNTFVLIASGYIFGGHLGFIINFLSISAGLLLIIFLVKKYGRPLLHKIISPKFYQRFD